MVIKPSQHFTLMPSRQLLHRRIKVNNAQGVINRQNPIRTMLKNSRQPRLLFHQRLRFQRRPQTRRQLRHEQSQGSAGPLSSLGSLSFLSAFKARAHPHRSKRVQNTHNSGVVSNQQRTTFHPVHLIQTSNDAIASTPLNQTSNDAIASTPLNQTSNDAIASTLRVS